MVASISASNSAAYYLKVDHALYYLSGELGVGQWYGEGAEALGYSGPVLPEQLMAAYDGLTPDGAASLVQSQGAKDRQSAWDITFSAPKSVSVLWSVLDTSDRRRIEELVLRAAKRAIDYLDAEAVMTRRGKQGNFVEHAKGIYALCPHGTSRSQDPQLHVHALAINLCLRADGTTGTIRSRDLYCHKMAAGALFRAELSHLLEKELGLSISQDTWKFKIDGVSERLCDEQSKRRKAIETIAREEGWHSPRILSELALRTRDAKVAVSVEECFEHWQETGRKHGFTREVAEALFSRSSSLSVALEPGVTASKERQSKLKKSLFKAVSNLASFKAHFPERDLVREVATLSQAKGFSADEIVSVVKRGVNRFENRVEIQGSPYLHYSTRENVAAEKELIERSLAGKASDRHLVTPEIVSKAKERVERSLSKILGAPLSLTSDQEKSLLHITQEVGSLKLIQGYAGTGKTQMLEAAHIAWKESGYHVIGAAITGRAAIGLQRATGIQSFTIDLLLKQLKPNLTLKEAAALFVWNVKSKVRSAYYDSIEAGQWLRNPYKQAFLAIARKITGEETKPRKLAECKITPNSVVVIDEAAMLPTKVLLAIKQECDKVGAKLVLVGDRLQLPPIEAGGPFWSLAKRVGHESLTTIVRQKYGWMRDALTHIINDAPHEALSLYAKNDSLHLAAHKNAAIEKLVADYRTLKPKELPQSLILTTTKEDARTINHAVQTQRKGARELGLNSIKLPNGERVHKNDRIMLTLNDYKLGIRNGFLGTVEKVHRTRGIMGPGSLTIRLDDQQPRGLFGRPAPALIVDLKKYPDVQLGYAVTTRKIQSITKDNCLVLISDPMLSKEQLFTQASRGKVKTKLYGVEAQWGDSLQMLAGEISRSTAKDLAHDHTLQMQRQRQQEQTQSL